MDDEEVNIIEYIKEKKQNKECASYKEIIAQASEIILRKSPEKKEKEIKISRSSVRKKLRRNTFKTDYPKTTDIERDTVDIEEFELFQKNFKILLKTYSFKLSLFLNLDETWVTLTGCGMKAKVAHSNDTKIAVRRQRNIERHLTLLQLVSSCGQADLNIHL